MLAGCVMRLERQRGCCRLEWHPLYSDRDRDRSVSRRESALGRQSNAYIRTGTHVFVGWVESTSTRAGVTDVNT